MTAPGLQPGGQSAGLASIGAVLARLKQEFPDVTISKIRFLESEGLVTPVRTPSGYRQFGPADVERLRYVLAAQRDHYLPLKVIKEQLDAIDNGAEPLHAAPRLPRSLVSAGDAGAPGSGRVPDVRRTRAELMAESGLSTADLRELEQYGIVAPGGGGMYDAEAVLVATTVAELLAAGLEPRHLRPFRTAAERESALVAQLVSAQAKQRDPDARERAEAEAAVLAATALRLHALLVKSGLRREFGR
ncbi:MerR family DNA-binding transcriptional regulator [Nakamurella sp. YIM 132087]|uniref:MerR family DNA-binding transcriptional regulator n=1 Tax=Nakamurella alba TaxID=2665158 RepID=A0A7K1FQZ8_9ACTN|nr:MerR family transcriptional regulator [Nakamurella alba]MTD16567.1 MerR family DNA-binding transcriptional regulator [Nakamurella alba]